MKRVSFVLFFISLLSLPLLAQKLTMGEATSGRYGKFLPKSYRFAEWIPNSDDFTHIVDFNSMHIAKASEAFQSTAFLSLQDLKNAAQSSSNDVLKEIDFSYFPYIYKWLNSDLVAFEFPAKQGKIYFTFQVSAKTIASFILLPENAAEAFPNADYSEIAYTDGVNIFLQNNKGQNKQITFDSLPGIHNGTAFVHRQEFGIDRGIWWSPDYTKLAFYRKDESMVHSYPLVQTDTRIAEHKPIRYPMAGMTSEQVQLLVYDLASQKTIPMQTGEKSEQFLTTISWNPASDKIFIGILNREQNHLMLKSFDVKNGKELELLFQEKAETYVEPLHPLIFVPQLPGGFLYQSEKSGFNSLYFFDFKSKNLKFLGVDNISMQEYLGYNAQSGLIYYTGTANYGLDRQLYAVSLKNGKTSKITRQSGVYKTILNDKATQGFFTFSNQHTPSVSGQIDLKNGKEKHLLIADNPYKEIDMPKIELVSITAADGKTPLNGRIIYPAQFDPNKKYPMIVYVYGGPHAQMITNSYLAAAPLWDVYMAQQGFIMFTLDNRGSDARGKDFEHVIHRQLGVNEVADQLKGVEFMKNKGFVDENKIGVYGWSFGGFMTLSLLLEYPETFKVGVAGGPVTDWKYYEVMYGERYMDTPEENPEGYEKSSVISKAGKLNSKLLVIHGAQDDVVVMQHSLEFINACIKAGKQVDYFLYPDHKHNVTGKDRVHLNQKIAMYFQDYLK